MSDLSQVWKQLGIYVRGAWVHQKLLSGSVVGKVGCTLRKSQNRQGKKHELGTKNVQQLLMDEELYSRLIEWG